MTQRVDVAALRFMTEVTGQLTEVQVQSVSSWPTIGIKDLKSHETRISLENREVTYQLKFKPKKSLKDFKVLKIIEESVWALVGDTWRTTFMVGKRILYAGVRRLEIKDGQGVGFGKGREGFDPTRARSLP